MPRTLQTFCFEKIMDLGKRANGFLIVGMWQELENHQQQQNENNLAVIVTKLYSSVWNKTLTKGPWLCPYHAQSIYFKYLTTWI